MKDTLRIRELTNNNPAAYANMELGIGLNASRGEVRACVYRPTGKGQFECISFMPDTLHNRAMTLRNSTLEVCEWDAGKKGWKQLDASLLDGYFSLPYNKKKEEPKKQEAPKDEPVVLNEPADFLKLSHEEQMKAAQGLIKDKEADQAFVKKIIGGLATLGSDKLAMSVKEYAKSIVRDWERADAS